MRINRVAASALAATALGAATAAHALDPQPLNADGPVAFIPTLSISQGYDDNFEERPDGEERSTNITRVAPSFLFRAQERQNRYQFRYTPTAEYYSRDSDNDRINHRAALTGRFVFDARNRLNLGLTASRNEQTISSANRAAGQDGDINQRVEATGTYRFGATGAQGQLELDVGYLGNRYRNNLDEGSERRLDEFNRGRVGLTYFWRVAPRTQVLAEGRYADFDYRDSDSDRDGDAVAGFVGAAWQATGATQGSVRVGRTERNFDASTRDDESTTSWEAAITWEPVERASVQLTTRRTLEEGSESVDVDGDIESVEDTVDQTLYRVSWRHQWDNRVSSTLGYELRDRDFKGGGNDGENDEITTWTLGLNYEVQRWLDVGVQARIKENDSTRGNSSYDRNSIFLTARMSL